MLCTRGSRRQIENIRAESGRSRDRPPRGAGKSCRRPTIRATEYIINQVKSSRRVGLGSHRDSLVSRLGRESAPIAPSVTRSVGCPCSRCSACRLTIYSGSSRGWWTATCTTGSSCRPTGSAGRRSLSTACCPSNSTLQLALPGGQKYDPTVPQSTDSCQAQGRPLRLVEGRQGGTFDGSHVAPFRTGPSRSNRTSTRAHGVHREHHGPTSNLMPPWRSTRAAVEARGSDPQHNTCLRTIRTAVGHGGVMTPPCWQIIGPKAGGRADGALRTDPLFLSFDASGAVREAGVGRRAAGRVILTSASGHRSIRLMTTEIEGKKPVFGIAVGHGTT